MEILFLSSATSKTQIYFQHINILMMLLTTMMTMVMMTMISAMMIVTKYSLPTIDFATRYSTRYSDFLLRPYSIPTRSKKKPTRLCLIIVHVPDCGLFAALPRPLNQQPVNYPYSTALQKPPFTKQPFKRAMYSSR